MEAVHVSTALRSYLDQELPLILEKEQIPGASVVVVKENEILVMQGVGWKDLEQKTQVTTKTRFAIGSTSKAFTAAVLGTLVDEGRLRWDDLVIDIVPEFRMKDLDATMRLTIRDIQCHRSGLPRHDLAWLLSDFSRGELVRNIRHLESFAPFRSLFFYNNFMWMLAGVVGERITGKSWEDNVRERIFEPLGMHDASFSVADMQRSSDYAKAYEVKEGVLAQIPPRPIDAIGPAGSINAHIEDYARWLMMNLNGGVFQGRQIISAQNLQEIHSPQMAIPVQDEIGAAFRMLGVFSDLVYTLGWVSVSYRGRPHLIHAGGIDGYSSFIAFLPREKLGVGILTNAGSITKHYGIGLEIIDRCLEDEPVGWVEKISALERMAQEEGARAEQALTAARVTGTQPSHPLEAYCGSYHHPGYGWLVLRCENGLLAGTYNQYPATLEHFHYDVFQLTVDDGRRQFKFPLQFISNRAGEISKALLPMEPKTPDIEFVLEFPEGEKSPA